MVLASTRERGGRREREARRRVGLCGEKREEDGGGRGCVCTRKLHDLSVLVDRLFRDSQQELTTNVYRLVTNIAISTNLLI